jgi:four helix bundle protein
MMQMYNMTKISQGCEAWRKRDYIAHFRSKLTDADGEAEETCHWLRTAVACGYMEESDGVMIAEEYSRVCGKLSRMMTNANSWTPSNVDSKHDE